MKQDLVPHWWERLGVKLARRYLWRLWSHYVHMSTAANPHGAAEMEHCAYISIGLRYAAECKPHYGIRPRPLTRENTDG